MKITPYLIALMVLVSSGCSTTPVTESSGRQVSSAMIYNPLLAKTPESKDFASVTILRDSGFFGHGCTHIVSVDGQKAFAIDPGEFLTVYLPPGDHFIGVETGGGLCPNISISQDVRLVSGQRASYRILLPSDGSLRLTRIK
jgi:hypothetical protein